MKSAADFKLPTESETFWCVLDLDGRETVIAPDNSKAAVQLYRQLALLKFRTAGKTKFKYEPNCKFIFYTPTGEKPTGDPIYVISFYYFRNSMSLQTEDDGKLALDGADAKYVRSIVNRYLGKASGNASENANPPVLSPPDFE